MRTGSRPFRCSVKRAMSTRRNPCWGPSSPNCPWMKKAWTPNFSGSGGAVPGKAGLPGFPGQGSGDHPGASTGHELPSPAVAGRPAGKIERPVRQGCRPFHPHTDRINSPPHGAPCDNLLSFIALEEREMPFRICNPLSNGFFSFLIYGQDFPVILHSFPSCESDRKGDIEYFHNSIMIS